MTHHVRDAEVISVGPDEVTVTAVTDPDLTITIRVGDDELTTTGPHHFARFTGLEEDTEHPVHVEGHPGGDPHLPPVVRTLARPKGALRATVVTTNDVHFGETTCGSLHDVPDDELGPVLRALPGEPPYPQTMNRAAVAEIAAFDPEVVVVKGDLTSVGSEEEYAQFLEVYGALGERMHHVRGNHDAMLDPDLVQERAPYVLEVGEVTLAVLDTVRPGTEFGQISGDQVGWLGEVAAATSGALLVFGHHHLWNLESDDRDPRYFGVNPDDSEALGAVVRKHENIGGYWAGHTHRHRVRRFDATRNVPFVEVGATKDYPGVWAEYRVHEGGLTQVVHRISSPAALEWTERTRPMFAGLYRDYALGSLPERCFTETW
jgi:predicted phosphodiesterase